jgi:hypothetical protein
VNGRLLLHENIGDFVAALAWLKKQPDARIEKIRKACADTAQGFSMKGCAQRALKIYVSLAVQGFSRRNTEESFWSNAVRSIQTQWGLAKNLTQATGAFISPELATVPISDTNTVQELAEKNLQD